MGYSRTGAYGAHAGAGRCPLPATLHCAGNLHRAVSYNVHMVKIMEPMFISSNSNWKPWKREELGNGKYRITKPGIRCPVCSDEQDMYRSVRVQYSAFTNKFGQTKTEADWWNSKCSCWTAMMYKNGRTIIMPSKNYDKLQRLLDDLKEIPSSIEVYLR